jgi:hypothetical protein
LPDAGLLPNVLQPDGGFVTTAHLILADAGVVATASSVYNFLYPPWKVLDSDVGTSWYVGQGICLAQVMSICCLQESITLSLTPPRSISAVVIRGNRDFDRFEFLTGHLEFVDASGRVISRGAIAFPRPKADWAGRFTPAISGVEQVRFIGGLAESLNPGISELELYTP